MFPSEHDLGFRKPNFWRKSLQRGELCINSNLLVKIRKSVNHSEVFVILDQVNSANLLLMLRSLV